MANTFIAPGQIISGSRTLDMAADTMAKMGKKALVVGRRFICCFYRSHRRTG